MKYNGLILNSTDRIDGTPSTCSFKLRNDIRGRKCCYLQYASIPNTFYNITDKNNNITINAGNVQITKGNYNLTEFLNALVNASATITNATYNDITSKITITLANAGDSLAFPTNNSMHQVLGFEQSYSATGTTHISKYPPSIYDLELFVFIENLSGSYSSSSPYTNTTFTIPNNANKDDIIYYYQKSQYTQIANINYPSFGNFTVHIKNQYGQNLEGLGEWTIILGFTD